MFIASILDQNLPIEFFEKGSSLSRTRGGGKITLEFVINYFLSVLQKCNIICNRSVFMLERYILNKEESNNESRDCLVLGLEEP